MIKRLLVAALALATINFSSCKSGGVQTTKEGLKYNILVDKNDGKTPGDSDVVKIKLRIYYSQPGKQDTLLVDWVKNNGGQPIEIPVYAKPEFKSDWLVGLKHLTKGDSAIFMVPADSVIAMAAKTQTQLPPMFQKGGTLLYSVVLVGTKSQVEVKKEQAAMEQQQMAMQQEMANKAGEQMGIDDKILQDYFAKNHLNPTKTESGLYYIMVKEGTGEVVGKGKTVSLNYTGKLLNGETFDSNLDPKFSHVEPLTYETGSGRTIKGWDEGVMLMKKGGKIKLFVPSPLAYGPMDNGPIKANSILTFDMELLDVK
ncbi:MAG: FKBP-type peptidyl-prolyl cis-trans isomerase [Bacteroidetes bacterium]|nr:FKBP-type peptidyl-prolyl cis-trans isomerase [Bacteroidota bacterium]